jgi:hypothetical protein
MSGVVGGWSCQRRAPGAERSMTRPNSEYLGRTLSTITGISPELITEFPHL